MKKIIVTLLMVVFSTASFSQTYPNLFKKNVWFWGIQKTNQRIVLADSLIYGDSTLSTVGIGERSSYFKLGIRSSKISDGILITNTYNGLNPPNIIFKRSRNAATVNNNDGLGTIGTLFYNGTSLDTGSIITTTVIDKTTGSSKIRLFANDGYYAMSNGASRGLTIFGQLVGIGQAVPTKNLDLVGNWLFTRGYFTFKDSAKVAGLSGGNAAAQIGYTNGNVENSVNVSANEVMLRSSDGSLVATNITIQPGGMANQSHRNVTSGSAITITSNVITITGTASVDSVSYLSTVPNYGLIYILFTGTAATTGMVNGGNMRLAGNFVYNNNYTMVLQRRGSTYYEISRSAN